jgi:hypothetical protein
VGKPSEEARANALAALLCSAGIDAHRAHGGARVLAEVHRPEGVIISALVGEAYEDRPLEDRTHDARAQPVRRAPRLGRLLLGAIDSDGEPARRTLVGELLRRETPLILIASPAGAVASRQWPGSEPALPAYPDERSFVWAAQDLGGSGPVAMAAMPPRDLFRWAAQQGSAVALNVYRDRASPLYFLLRAADVAALARGELPGARIGK